MVLLLRQGHKNVPDDKRGEFGYGDVWTWTAIWADTKLAASWLVGNRDADTAAIFLGDLKDRLANRVQLTSNGHSAYLSAVEDTFGADVDYAQLGKLYGVDSEAQRRYSLPKCLGAKGRQSSATLTLSTFPQATLSGRTSNLTMRMSMRFIRLCFIHSLSLHVSVGNCPRVILPSQHGAATDLVAADGWGIEIDELQAHLDAWIEGYNQRRSRQGQVGATAKRPCSLRLGTLPLASKYWLPNDWERIETSGH